MCEPLDTIEEVFPRNVLEKIVEKIPWYNRRQLALVSHSFHKAVCKIEEPTCIMKITNEILNDNSMIQLMTSTIRRILKVKIEMHLSDDNLNTAADILEGREDEVQEISIKSAGYSNTTKFKAASLVNLLKKVPNVKSLFFEFSSDWQITNWTNYEPFIGAVTKGMVSLRINNLLEFKSARGFAQMFTPHSIQKLQTYGCYNPYRTGNLKPLLETLIKYQQKITELSINDNYLMPEIFKSLHLIRFEFYHYHHEMQLETTNALLLQLVEDHPEMRSLNFIDCFNLTSRSFAMSPALLTALCNIPNLEILQLMVTKQNIGSFHQLARLSATTKVALYFNHFDYKCDKGMKEALALLTHTPLPNLEKLEIEMELWEGEGEYRFLCSEKCDEERKKRQARCDACFSVPERFYENINRNWPNIKEFKFNELSVNINAALENLEMLEKLDIGLRGENLSFHHNSSVYLNMKSLIIRQVKSTSNLLILLLKMPNLETLSICDDSSTEYYDFLLETFSKMKSLKVLYIGFEIMSDKAIASAKEVEMLKKLCTNLDEFSISFNRENKAIIVSDSDSNSSFDEASSGNKTLPFASQLYEKLQNCCFMDVFIDNGGTGKYLVLQKNAQKGSLKREKAWSSRRSERSTHSIIESRVDSKK